jgi:hypothetical protein
MQQKLPDAEAQAALGNARIYRATVRMFKVPPGLIEPTCEVSRHFVEITIS